MIVLIAVSFEWFLGYDNTIADIQNRIRRNNNVKYEIFAFNRSRSYCIVGSSIDLIEKSPIVKIINYLSK